MNITETLHKCLTKLIAFAKAIRNYGLKEILRDTGFILLFLGSNLMIIAAGVYGLQKSANLEKLTAIQSR